MNDYTDDTTSHIVTLPEAVALIQSIKGKKHFSIMAGAFMPTTEDRGFEGFACVSVSASAFQKVLRDMLAEPFAAKGARLQLYVSPPMFQGSATTIAIY